MAGAREFCRNPGYPVTIFLTYSFDPLFFERIPWTDLEVGGSRRIVIAADVDQVAEAMRRCSGQIAHLGRRYVLAETNAADVFHPKLIARLSPEGGQVWIGSGNLTYTGWGGNRELATSWSIGPSEEDKGTWLDEIIETVGQSISSTTFFDQLREIRAEIPWLTRQEVASLSAPVLLGTQYRPLAPQLAERWKGRKFDELRICTGSTDVDGAFLSWAHRTFGIRRALVCVSPAYASFEPDRLSKLPLDVKIIVAPPEQLMHAKFYWFSGKGGPAAIVGSANCSAAAWLSRNVEIVVPYDDPIEAEFESILSLFKATAHDPAIVLNGKSIKADTFVSEASSHRLVSLRLRSADTIEALIQPAVATNAEVSLVLRDAIDCKPIELSWRSNIWSGRLPVNFQIGPLTLFAHAEGMSDNVHFATGVRWVDNDGLLERATRASAMDAGLSKLSREQFSARDDQHIIETIQSIAVQLLDPAANVADVPQFSRQANGEGGNTTQQNPQPVDPSVLIRSLSDVSRNPPTSIQVRGGIGGSTLAGVIALLFGQQKVEDVDLKRETWSEEDFQGAADDLETKQQGLPSRVDTEAKLSSLEVSISFRREIKLFVAELGKPSFAATCGAAQMVQALAFPLLLCIRGNQASWVPRTLLTNVATQIAELMFNKRYGPGCPSGLLAMVGDRYFKAGQHEEFSRSVGDGTLWLALLAALAIDPADPRQSVLPQASAVSSVLNSRELLTLSDANYLSSLLRGLDTEIAQVHMVEKVQAIAQSVSALVALLTASWDTLSKEQKSARSLQPANALLWSVSWGWSVTADSPAETSRYGFINLESAAEDHPEIELAIQRVYEACGSPQKAD